MATETVRSEGNAVNSQAPATTEGQAVFAIEGMTCASCAMRVEKGLKKVPGVKDANVNLASEKATVTFDPLQTGIEQMVQKVDAVGYKATLLVVPQPSKPVVQEPETDTCTVLDLEGMTCASRAMRIEKGLKKVPGVKDVSVNLATEKATVTYDPTQTGIEQMVQKVEAVGYKATEQTAAPSLPRSSQVEPGTTALADLHPSTVGPSQVDEQSKRRQAEITRKRNLLILGSILTVPIVILSMFFMHAFPGENYLLLALTTPVWAIVGWEFHRGAIKTLRHASANMDTLISVASTAAYPMSVVATFFPQVVGATTFYDTAALIITLIFLGKYLEARAKGQTNEAIKKLMGLQAQGSKAPIQRLADTISSIFVPTVLVIASLTFIGWAVVGHLIASPAQVGGMAAMNNPWIVAIIAAVAVLVVACPCALGLATPTAIMVGTGKGAEKGILIRGGESLERIQAVRAVLLDKTGTTTKGKPELTDVVALSGKNEDEMLRLVSTAERGSEHPLATAIVEGARAPGLVLNTSPARFTAIAGGGLEAKVEGHDVLVGTRRLLSERAIAFTTLEADMEVLEGQGKTVMLAAIDGEIVGLVAVSDTVKVGSVEAVQQLSEQGLAVWMITGDNRRAAQAIAAQVGIPAEHVLAEVLPEDKANQVKRFQEQWMGVAFAVDGINDAPALVQSDAGIAMGTGTDIAMEASDITLVKGNLKSVATALALSWATLRTIKQNLFWAFAYNVILIPTAILSPLIPLLRENAPIFAAAAMALSSVTVVSNSLRLRRFGR